MAAKGRPADGWQSPSFRTVLMPFVLTALLRYLTNSATQTQKYVFSQLHTGGFFFDLLFTEFHLNIDKENIIGILFQKYLEKEKGIQKSLWKFEEIQI